MTISLVSGGVPCQSTCSPWATIADLCPPCDTGDYDEQTMAGHLQVASDILFHLSGRQFAGSCVAEGSMVQTEFGSRRIEEVQVGERVWSWTEQGPVLQTVTATQNNGIRPIVEIRMYGRSLFVTTDHRVLVLKRGTYAGHNVPTSWWTEWVEAGDLRPNDLLVAHGPLVSDDNPDVYLPDGTLVDEDVAWLLGLLIGDGWIEKTGTVGVAGGGPPVAKAAEIFQRVWGLELRQRRTYKWNHRVSSRGLVRALRQIGFGPLAHEKQVPELVWHLDPKLQRAFVEGYLAADGHWHEKKHWVHACASPRLMEQMRSLCMRLGDPVSNILRVERPLDMKSPNPKYPFKEVRPLWTFVSHPRQRRVGQRITRFVEARRALGTGFRPIRVLGIEDAGQSHVYDLTVESTHNFFAEGLVVHNCQDVVRPCARSLVMDHGRPLHGGYYSGPWLGGDYSQWGFCSCNQTERSGCSSVPEITLGVYPLTGIVEVKIDGAVVDPTTYRIDDNRWLVRTADANGQPLGWKCCQNMQLDSDQLDTFEVTFVYGTPAPPGGVRACAELACQLALACDPSKAGSCSLPQRVTQVTRQGMTAVVLDPMAFLDKGKTGLYAVDLWLGSINPSGLRRRSVVMSPDIGKRTRRAGF